MRGTRIKKEGEQLPVTEKIGLRPGPMVQFRYDFRETELEDGTEIFLFNYVNVIKYDRDTIVSAIIRTRYSRDRVEAILRKKARGEDVIDFIKYNHFVNYAKAAFDEVDMTALKNAEVYEIVIPLLLTLSGNDYAQLADKSLKLNIPYESDAVNQIAKAFPSWLTSEDETALENDTRVIFSKIPLFDETL